jgi:hypothetical protein
MNNSRFRTNRKIELYEDFRFNDKIYELQNDVRHNRRYRLKNRVNERQDCFFVRQDSRKRLCCAIHKLRTENQLNLQIKQNIVRSKAIFESLIRDVN